MVGRDGGRCFSAGFFACVPADGFRIGRPPLGEPVPPSPFTLSKQFLHSTGLLPDGMKGTSHSLLHSSQMASCICSLPPPPPPPILFLNGDLPEAGLPAFLFAPYFLPPAPPRLNADICFFIDKISRFYCINR